MNNPEVAFFATSRRLGQLQGEGFDLTGEQEVTHSFMTFEDSVALRKALWEQGFQVSERQGTPGLEARRREDLSIGGLRRTVEQLCRTADKYAAQYDGWDLSARMNQSGEDR